MVARDCRRAAVTARRRGSRTAGMAAGVALCLAALSAARAATGFFVSANGDFVSAYHVIGECRRPAVRIAGAAWPAVPVAASASADLALIRTKGRRSAYARFPRNLRAELNQPLIIVSARGGVADRFLPGEVVRRVAYRGGALFVRSKQPILTGDSGSPLLSRRGALIGLLIAHGRHSRYRGIAVDALTVAEFVAGAGVAIETLATPLTTTARAAADLAAAYTFPVVCRD